MKLALHRGVTKTGYGTFGDGLERGLRAAGVEVVGPDDPAPCLLYALPPHFYPGKRVDQRAWCFAMWEADGCPEGLRAGFGNFEGLIVPTPTNLAALSQWHPNVHLVPLAVDWQFWTPRPRKLDGTFRFLYTKHSPTRKGGDLAEAAVEKLKRDGYDVELVPATHPTDEGLRDLFWSAHAYLQPSRGEGWGMMPHQALASGMPVVISDCPGHREYGWLPGCYLTKTVRVPSKLCFHGDPGYWWEPDPVDLVQTMRTVIDGYGEAHAAAQQAWEECRDLFDWGQVAAQIVALMGDAMSGPDAVGEWVAAEFEKYPATPVRDVDAQIGRVRYRLRAGEEVLLPADAKRVLVKSGAIVESGWAA